MFPALLLNYLGQAALVLRQPEAVESPFYLLAPRWLLYPLLGLATLATVIASQALISGAFSLTRQAVRLGYVPRVTIFHTSRTEMGQVYLPEINALLMVGCLLIVLEFRSSSALGAAYGIAVSGTMAVTSVLFYMVARHRWHWPAWRAGGLAALFLALDLAFLERESPEDPRRRLGAPRRRGGGLRSPVDLEARHRARRARCSSGRPCPSSRSSQSSRVFLLPASPAPPSSSAPRLTACPPSCCSTSSTTRPSTSTS